MRLKITAAYDYCRSDLRLAGVFFRSRWIDIVVVILGLAFILLQNLLDPKIRPWFQALLTLLAVISVWGWASTRVGAAVRLIVGSLAFSLLIGLISALFGEPTANQTLFDWTGRTADEFPITQRLASIFFTFQATTQLSRLLIGLTLSLVIIALAFPISHLLFAAQPAVAQPAVAQSATPRSIRQRILEFLNVNEQQLPMPVSAGLILMFSRTITIAVIPGMFFGLLSLQFVNDWGMDRIRDQLYLEFLSPTRCSEKTTALADLRIHQTSDGGWTAIRYQSGQYEYLHKVLCTIK